MYKKYVGPIIYLEFKFKILLFTVNNYLLYLKNI